ncbi:MAG: alpha/beta fold hydrolase [Motiliproteus sp.]
MNQTAVMDQPAALILDNGPENATSLLLLAHGAGAGMDHEFMESIAIGLAEQGIRVIRFEFPYMQIRRADGGRRPPDRMPKLLEAYARQLKETQTRVTPTTRVFIGGKSMGGRVASLLAAQLDPPTGIAGVICLGFPFHPPGKPEKFRGEHLSELQTPLLIAQGERDTFGTQAEVGSYTLSDSVQCHFLGDGDHSLKPRKRSGLTLEQNLSETVMFMKKFIERN